MVLRPEIWRHTEKVFIYAARPAECLDRDVRLFHRIPDGRKTLANGDRDRSRQEYVVRSNRHNSTTRAADTKAQPGYHRQPEYPTEQKIPPGETCIFPGSVARQPGPLSYGREIQRSMPATRIEVLWLCPGWRGNKTRCLEGNTNSASSEGFSLVPLACCRPGTKRPETISKAAPNSVAASLRFHVRLVQPTWLYILSPQIAHCPYTQRQRPDTVMPGPLESTQ